MLEYDLDAPPEAEDGWPLIVLLHGRGSDRRDLMGLRPGLPPRSLVVTVDAPFPAAPWGYGPGFAWYRYIGEDRPEPETFLTSQEKLGELLDGIPDRMPVRPGPIVLGGFSQGGTMSVGYALRHLGKVALVLNFSGFVPSAPGVDPRGSAARDLPIFWGHGLHDPAIPHALAVRGRAALAAGGARLEARDYPMGHGILPEELADARAWMETELEAVGAERGG